MKIWRWIYRSLAVLLLLYAGIAAFLVDVPDLPPVYGSIRMVYFHVGMWFAMMILLFVSLVNSLMYMKHARPHNDLAARIAVQVAVGFGVIGIISGMIWARYAWGTWWLNDPKLNGAAITMLAYLAYLLLRASIRDEVLKARISAVYNILAFVMMLVFLMVLPRLAEFSMHPGQQGNPASPGDLDPSMRLVFYPAMLAWILLGIWIFEWLFLRNRRKKITTD